MTLTGNKEGKLHVRRQVEDYALRGLEFEGMGFLTFTVETYERRITLRTNDSMEEENNDENDHTQNGDSSRRYLASHPKSGTHTRIIRSESHNFLPNIVGPWLPRRDGEENTKSYYYAAMLALLKPWRNLQELKADEENWETTFAMFILNANQRDKDVVAGCQYYYESRSDLVNREVEEERDHESDDEHDDDFERHDDLPIESIASSVSDSFFQIKTQTKKTVRHLSVMKMLHVMKSCKDKIKNIFMVN